ncbi:MAG: carbon-nitrogen hydrolase [Bacteroidia bacterium]|nr:carbon-nitrogen hydrolase [Bacteroidia bacterium]
MSNKTLRISVGIIAMIGISWIAFLSNTNTTAYITKDFKVDLLELDSTYCSNLLIGVQVEVDPFDYQSTEALFQKLHDHLNPYKEKILSSNNRVIVFPEHIGTWLVATDEYPSIYHSGSITKAMLRMILSHPIKYLQTRLKGTEAPNATQAGIFLFNAEKMATAYQTVFSRLAKEYKATVIAGSIVLPDPVAESGQIKFTGKKLYNTSFVFLPDGSLSTAVTKKVFPVDFEQTFCAAGNVEDMTTVPMATGNIATLICADSWYPEIYEKIRAQSASIIVVPSYSVGERIMASPWQGYNGFAPPSGIELSDVMQISEEAAWDKYALSGRILESEIGLNVFLRGQLWDMESDGRSKMVVNGQDHKTNTNGAVILMVCLP